MTLKFRGLFEPHEIPTGDRRAFKSMSLTNRDLPLPLMMRTSSGGHAGAEVVASITKIEQGPKGRWYSGDFLDPKIVPEVVKAIYLTRKKLLGPSVDLDRSFTVESRMHTDGKPMAYFTSGKVIGVTLVPMPAFADVTFEVEGDDADMETLTAAINAPDFQESMASEFAVSQANWDGLPVAPRDYPFDADDAVKRIAQWAGIGTPKPDVNRYASMFLWRGGNETGNSLAQEDFRLPIGDIVQGQPYLVFHAIYAAAALLSGAHGGLPNIPDQEKSALKGVINQIYPKMAKAFGDESMHSPFAPGEGEQQQMSESTEDFAAKAEPYGDVTYADPGYRDNKKRYPVDTPEHIRAAWSYINVASNAAEYTPEQLKSIKSKIMAAARKNGIEISEQSSEMSLDDEGELTSFAIQKTTHPERPSKSVFDRPNLAGPTPLTVTDDGRVFGHIGKWGQCHIGIGDKCVLLPHSRTDYQLFKSGTVRTAEGVDVQVGKITIGTGHAHPTYGIIPSREHYDNSGWCAAVVVPYEDKFGVAVAGVITDKSKIDELRRSPLSGDWRRYNGHLELVAALAVNNPGFPVFHQEESEEFSLCAAGMIEHIPQADSVFTEPPVSLDMSLVDYEKVRAEVADSLLASMRRQERYNRARTWGEQRAQNQRAERLYGLLGLTAAAPSVTAKPATGKPAEGQDLNGDGVIDPESDPNSPGIAESDDPGRETMLARQADAQYTVIAEEADNTQPADQQKAPQAETTQPAQQSQPVPQSQPATQQATQPAQQY